MSILAGVVIENLDPAFTFLRYDASPPAGIPTTHVVRLSMKLDNLHADLLLFDQARDVDALTAILKSHCDRLGFDSFIYALRVPTRLSESTVHLIKGYPDEWLDRYFVRGYYDLDPVIAHASRRVVPARWQDLAPAAGSGARNVMNEATEFGLRSGLSMPIHSPRGELGILSFAHDRPTPRSTEIVDQALQQVQWLAGYLHEAARRVLGLTDPSSAARLTNRERECLRWAADGKTSWEIARLLSKSERTVNFHLNNAMAKLNVCNRQHAIAKAVTEGIIGPRPF